MKNLAPYCSSNDDRFLVNNKTYMVKLFNSIVLQEHLGLDMIPTEIINIVASHNSIFRQQLREILYEMFELASITDWTISNYGHGHWRVKDANGKRIEKRELGYLGTYDDRWNQKFKDAYQKIFSLQNENDVILKLFNEYNGDIDKCYDKIEALLIDFKDEFLGCPRNMYNKIFPSKCSKTCNDKCFKNLLLSMYDTGLYDHELEQYSNNDGDSVCWLNDICDFKKGFSKIENQLMNLFCELFLVKLEQENKKNIQLILKINNKITTAYEELKAQISKSFLGANEEGDSLFNMVLSYIMENKISTDEDR